VLNTEGFAHVHEGLKQVVNLKVSACLIEISPSALHMSNLQTGMHDSLFNASLPQFGIVTSKSVCHACTEILNLWSQSIFKQS
jgi:hypothetical protein